MPAAPGNSSAPPPPAEAAPTFDFTFDASLVGYDVAHKAYLASHPEFNAIAVGALVTARDGPGGSTRLLLIQRAAHDLFPLRWEIPGGACEHDDASLLHSVARELWEETGLLMRRVVRRVNLGPKYSGLLGKGSEDGAVFFTRGRRLIKYTFLVEVEQPPVIKLDPNEHERFLWATEDECRAGRVGDVAITFTTDQQQATIMEAFRVCKEEPN